jgi:DNA-binding NarL/FixJ family response regulator
MVVNLVLVDDHSVVRHGLRLVLEELGFKVVGEGSDGLEAIELVAKLKPDILLCDLMMGSMNGLEVTRQVSKKYPDTKVVILSMYSDEGYVIEALRAGAKAYILKDSSSAELNQTINEVMKGKHYLGSPFSEKAISTYMDKTQDASEDEYYTLSNREREILQMVAEGLTSVQIAKKLFLSSRTVDAHRAKMMRKLNLHTKVDLIRYAQHRGIIPTDNVASKEADLHSS